jgi:hypothetical protein
MAFPPPNGREAAGTVDAGTPGCRMNNLKNAPETADFPNSARGRLGVEWAGNPPAGRLW